MDPGLCMHACAKSISLVPRPHTPPRAAGRCGLGEERKVLKLAGTVLSAGSRCVGGRLLESMSDSILFSVFGEGV